MIGGRYELERELARGGMGAVWLGSDVVLDRAVAIKRVGVTPGGSSPDLLRAEREARIAASLSHPHIVGVFDLVHDRDQQWLVMEYVEGSTLADLIHAHGSLTGAQAAALLAQAAAALQAAHAAGIVHRDVKPSNILVRADGQAKLSDFGIARAEADASLTQTGLVTGSPAYLAPEVASGQHATPASDVWSLGATLFHALAGHPPYDVKDNVLGALYRIVHEPPPRLSDPGELGPLLEATMTLDPAARWSMGEVQRFLEERAGEPPSISPVPVGDARGTEVMAPASAALAPAAPVPPLPPLAEEPAAAAGGPGRGGDRRRNHRRPVLPAAIALVVVALVAAVALLLLGGGDDDDPGVDPTAAPTSTPPSSPSPTETPPTPEPTPTPTPDAADMRSFARSYVQTAAADPEAGFRMLTPAYQASSGGLAGYRGFWASVSDPQITEGTVSADADALTVDYTYSYRLDNGTEQSNDVTLQLEFDPETDSYLIAGDRSS